VPIEIQAMKAAILFLDGVNFARSYLSHVRLSIKKITGHAIQKS